MFSQSTRRIFSSAIRKFYGCLQLKTKTREKALQPEATDALRLYFPLSLGFRLLIVAVHLTWTNLLYAHLADTAVPLSVKSKLLLLMYSKYSKHHLNSISPPLIPGAQHKSHYMIPTENIMKKQSYFLFLRDHVKEQKHIFCLAKWFLRIIEHKKVNCFLVQTRN